MPDCARFLILDIETYATSNPAARERIRQAAIEKRPPGNCKKEIKLAWDTEQAREERAAEAVAKTALDVLLAEPLCVCYDVDGEPVQADMMRNQEDETLAALAQVWNEQAGPGTIWAGHNLEGFDLRILLNRWRAHGIAPPAHFPVFNAGRWRGRVYDTMLRTPSNSGVNMVSLRAVCEAYGLPAAKTNTLWKGEPLDGAQVGAAFEAGEYDLILEYCADDVQVQRDLYMAQTKADTWGTYPREDDLEAAADDIHNSNLTEAQKQLALAALADRAV